MENFLIICIHREHKTMHTNTYAYIREKLWTYCRQILKCGFSPTDFSKNNGGVVLVEKTQYMRVSLNLISTPSTLSCNKKSINSLSVPRTIHDFVCLDVLLCWTPRSQVFQQQQEEESTNQLILCRALWWKLKK